MNMKVPTVKVKGAGDSFIIINESDFVEGEHELFGTAVESDAGEMPNEGTNAWYKLQLGLRGIAYDKNATKAQLKAAYDEVAQ